MKKKILAVFLAALMMLALIPLGAMVKTEEGTKTISGSNFYFYPSDNWKLDNARFEAYFWNNEGNQWYTLSDTDNDGFYTPTTSFSGGWNNVIIVRKDPNSAEHVFPEGSNTNGEWNRIADLPITDGCNCYTLLPGGSGNNPAGFWWDYESGYTVYSVNAIGWSSMKIYYTLSSGYDLTGTWSGFTMTSCGNNVYKTKIPSNANLIVFNNGGSGSNSQTEDITTDIADGACWKITSGAEKANAGKSSLPPTANVSAVEIRRRPTTDELGRVGLVYIYKVNFGDYWFDYKDSPVGSNTSNSALKIDSMTFDVTVGTNLYDNNVLNNIYAVYTTAATPYFEVHIVVKGITEALKETNIAVALKVYHGTDLLFTQSGSSSYNSTTNSD